MDPGGRIHHWTDRLERIVLADAPLARARLAHLHLHWRDAPLCCCLRMECGFRNRGSRRSDVSPSGDGSACPGDGGARDVGNAHELGCSRPSSQWRLLRGSSLTPDSRGASAFRTSPALRRRELGSPRAAAADAMPAGRRGRVSIRGVGPRLSLSAHQRTPPGLGSPPRAGARFPCARPSVPTSVETWWWLEVEVSDLPPSPRRYGHVPRAFRSVGSAALGEHARRRSAPARQRVDDCCRASGSGPGVAGVTG